MNKFFIIIFFVFIYCSGNSQTLNDKIFKDVIHIDDRYVITVGGDFLVNIPINVQESPLIIFNDSKIPTILFFEKNHFLKDQKELIIITAEVEYNNKNEQNNITKNEYIQPLNKYIVYHIDRRGNESKIEEIKITAKSEDDFKMIFKDKSINNDEEIFYFENFYGSNCCPRDKKWDMKDQIDNEVSMFEKTYKVNISNEVILKPTGKEGEHYEYYRLSQLSAMKKVKFLNQMKSLFQEQKNGKKLTYISIYAPISVKK